MMPHRQSGLEQYGDLGGRWGFKDQTYLIIREGKGDTGFLYDWLDQGHLSHFQSLSLMQGAAEAKASQAFIIIPGLRILHASALLLIPNRTQCPYQGNGKCHRLIKGPLPYFIKVETFDRYLHYAVQTLHIAIKEYRPSRCS